MNESKLDALSYIYENDVKFIRLQFCDIFGTLKNISIMPSELERAFDDGISFDPSSIRGFLGEDDGNLLIFPDPSTLSVLPWRPQTGRVVRFFCNIMRPNNVPFEGDCRAILQNTLNRAKEKGFTVNVGSKCEFYLFKTDEEGNPVLQPHDSASYFDVAPTDKGENIRREICLTLEEMGLTVESSHHESGTGQHQIDFKYDNALAAADNLITFKTVVKTVAGRSGLFASFMPKPIKDMDGNGLHINLSVKKDDVNIFEKAFEEGLGDMAQSFTAGIIHHIKGLSLILNPLVNSYKRLGCSRTGPKNISWSRKNKSQLIRIPFATGKYCRMELRSPDPSCNPYLAFAAIIQAGLEGIDKKLPLSKEAETTGDLPSCLILAIQEAKKDKLVKAVLGDYIFEKYLAAKLNEWSLYEKEVDTFDIKQYFDKV